MVNELQDRDEDTTCQLQFTSDMTDVKIYMFKMSLKLMYV